MADTLEYDITAEVRGVMVSIERKHKIKCNSIQGNFFCFCRHPDV